METLRVALVSDWFYPKIGGIETHIHELALNLLRAGHEPHVITHDYRHHEGIRSWDDRKLPYPVHRLHGSIYFKRVHVSLGPGALVEANRLYKRLRFDVTHVHSIYSPLGVAVAKVSRGIRDVGVVATNHSLFSWDSKVSKLTAMLVRRSLRHVDVFIAVSRVVEEDTKRLLGDKLGDRPLLRIPNAVDPVYWRPPEPEERERARKLLGIGSDEYTVLVIGRFTKRKAVHRAPRLAAAAAEKTGRRTRLLIVGDGELRRLVEEEAARYSNGLLRVDIHGFQPRERLRLYYWAADTTLITSRMEAFSITAVESMATGTPVVGYRGCGLEDVVAPGTGFLAGSDDEVVEALAMLAADEELRHRMAAAAARRAQALFTWDAVLPKILDAYRLAMTIAETEDKHYLLHRAWLEISRRLRRGRGREAGECPPTRLHTAWAGSRR